MPPELLRQKRQFYPEMAQIQRESELDPDSTRD